MDLFKALIGKKPNEFELAAKTLVNEPNVELFKKLVQQDEFLFDFVKNNVAKRIEAACNENNYKNLLQFFDYYSPAYGSVFADIIYKFGNIELLPKMKEFILRGSSSQKSYALKFILLLNDENLTKDMMQEIREIASSEEEYLSANAIEVLSKNNDTISKENAIKQLDSSDEFEQYSAIKFLVTYGAKDVIHKIISIMKKSSLSENIAAEIPFLEDLETLLSTKFEDAILVLCNIVNAIPEIIPPSAVVEYGLLDIFENLNYNLSSPAALLLRMAKEKFATLEENEEYLFDCDKITKDEVANINKFFKGVNTDKLKSLLYEELFEESNFVLFAVDYVDEVEELETLLDSSNQTLVLKVLTCLKDKQALQTKHKEAALVNVTSNDIRQIIEIL